MDGARSGFTYDIELFVLLVCVLLPENVKITQPRPWNRRIFIFSVVGDHGETLACRHQVHCGPIRRVTLWNRALSAFGACLCQAERLARAKRSFNRCQRSLLQQSLKWNERLLPIIDHFDFPYSLSIYRKYTVNRTECGDHAHS